MISLDDRLLTVCKSVWAILPPAKRKAHVTAIGISDLGARNGSYDPQEGTITLNYRLLGNDTPQSIPMIDCDSNMPPQRYPCISRLFHTLTHEYFHAIGTGMQIDLALEWLALSEWSQSLDTPQGTARYHERRPGWNGQGPSDWRYNTSGTFFVREYSSRSPFEDQADCCTHLALGWTDAFTHAPPLSRANALAKLAYLRRYVWEEKGVQAVQASRARWYAARQPSACVLREE